MYDITRWYDYNVIVYPRSKNNKGLQLHMYDITIYKGILDSRAQEVEQLPTTTGMYWYSQEPHISPTPVHLNNEQILQVWVIRCSVGILL